MESSFLSGNLSRITPVTLYSCFELDDEEKLQKGLKVLHELIPNIKSIKINYLDSVDEIDISDFKNLTSLDLSHNECLNNIIGIEKLKKLTYLNLRCSPELISPNIQNIKNIKEVYGLRDEMGLITGNQIDTEHWGDTLQEWLDWDFIRYNFTSNL